MPSLDMDDDDGMVLNLGSNIKRGPILKENGMPYHERRNPRAKSKKMQKAPSKFAPAMPKPVAQTQNSKPKPKPKSKQVDQKIYMHNSNNAKKTSDNVSRATDADEVARRASGAQKRSVTDNGEDASSAAAVKKPRNEGSKSGGAEHISSLFSNNPDMPEILSRQNEVVNVEMIGDAPSSHANNVFHEAKTFEILGVSKRLVRCMNEKMGLTQPTTVQSSVIPPALNGRDVLAQSETGSGKTMSFLLPIVEILSSFDTRIQRSDGIQALIISPTRELCLQILDVLEALLHPVHWIVPGHVIGGEKKKSEKARIRKGINVLVATPGRLVDHLNTTSCLNVSRCRILVLDEADRLMELGFKKDLITIINALNGYHPNFIESDSVGAERNEDGILQPKIVKDRFIPGKNIRRQAILVSATLNSNVRMLAELALKDPVRIVLTGDTGSDTIAEEVEVVPEVISDTMAVNASDVVDKEGESDEDNSADERVVDFMTDDEVEDANEDVLESEPKTETEPKSTDTTTGVTLGDDENMVGGASISEDVSVKDDIMTIDETTASKASELSILTVTPAEATTIPSSVEAGVNETMTTFKTPSKLVQKYVAVPSKLRLVTLAALLRGECTDAKGNPTSKAIVFMSTCDLVDFVYEIFNARTTWGNKGLQGNEDAPFFGRLHIVRLHGNMKQQERTQAFKKFSKAPTGVLICTDVAARGLDLPFVKWIVQYTIPAEVADYVHRIGRTARLGESGSSVVFVTPGEADFIQVLEEKGMNVVSLEMNDLLGSLCRIETVASRERKIRQNGGARPKPQALSNKVQGAATALQMEIEEQVKATDEMHWLARNAFRSYLRGYMTYPKAMKQFMHIKNLHQGHVAKSFGMREAPSDVLKQSKKSLMNSKKGSEKDKMNAREQKKRQGGGTGPGAGAWKGVGNTGNNRVGSSASSYKGNGGNNSTKTFSNFRNEGGSGSAGRPIVHDINAKGPNSSDKDGNEAMRRKRNVGGQNNKSSRGETTVKDYARASGYRSKVPLGMNGIDRTKFARAPIGPQ